MKITFELSEKDAAILETEIIVMKTIGKRYRISTIDQLCQRLAHQFAVHCNKRVQEAIEQMERPE